jgi:hypothetical protein
MKRVATRESCIQNSQQRPESSRTSPLRKLSLTHPKLHSKSKLLSETVKQGRLRKQTNGQDQNFSSLPVGYPPLLHHDGQRAPRHQTNAQSHNHRRRPTRQPPPSCRRSLPGRPSPPRGRSAGRPLHEAPTFEGGVQAGVAGRDPLAGPAGENVTSARGLGTREKSRTSLRGTTVTFRVARIGTGRDRIIARA